MCNSCSPYCHCWFRVFLVFGISSLSFSSSSTDIVYRITPVYWKPAADSVWISKHYDIEVFHLNSSLNLCLHSCSCKHWRIVQVALEGSVLKAVRLNRLGLVLAHQKILTANRLWRKKINPLQMLQWCDVKIIRVGSTWKASWCFFFIALLSNN